MLNVKSSSIKLSLFDTYDRQGNDGKKRQDTKQELLVAEYETDVYEIITIRFVILNDKISVMACPENNFDEAATRKHS